MTTRSPKGARKPKFRVGMVVIDTRSGLPFKIGSVDGFKGYRYGWRRYFATDKHFGTTELWSHSMRLLTKREYRA